MPTNNANIPYSQQEAIAIGYAQYALMQSLTQQLRVNYPAAFLHAAAAAAATGFMPLPPKITPGTASNEKSGERRKPVPESDNNNNHIRVTPFSNQEQPYRRETYQTLLESSQLLGQHKLPRPVPIDLRKQQATNRPVNHSECIRSIAEVHVSPSSFRSYPVECSLHILLFVFDFSDRFAAVSKSAQIDSDRTCQ